MHTVQNVGIWVPIYTPGYTAFFYCNQGLNLLYGRQVPVHCLTLCLDNDHLTSLIRINRLQVPTCRIRSRYFSSKALQKTTQTWVSLRKFNQRSGMRANNSVPFPRNCTVPYISNVVGNGQTLRVIYNGLVDFVVARLILQLKD